MSPDCTKRNMAERGILSERPKKFSVAIVKRKLNGINGQFGETTNPPKPHQSGENASQLHKGFHRMPLTTSSRAAEAWPIAMTRDYFGKKAPNTPPLRWEPQVSDMVHRK